ncbi:DUF4133 domain-containing protein [Rufibacter sp. LB8]|uniref:DUF4133 domain-containing protein n=1 Tax=Rufibacter sp. LB8 TaxID=2777781 RepID=UPI00351C0C3D
MYRLNKGINRPIEFKGLKAQYIGYLAGGLVALLLSFTFLYLLGTPLYLVLGLTLMGGSGLFIGVFRLSRTYGTHGLMKRWARHRLPHSIRCRSRHAFLRLKNP